MPKRTRAAVDPIGGRPPDKRVLRARAGLRLRRRDGGYVAGSGAQAGPRLAQPTLLAGRSHGLNVLQAENFAERTELVER